MKGSYEDIIQEICETEDVNWREAEAIFADRLADEADQRLDAERERFDE
jgi:hypothetical protein